MRSKISIVVIALCLVFGMAFTAYAAPMPDIEKHWAKEQINAWVGKGLINGYEDGTFRPDNNITRAEFMALVNRAFNYQEKVEIDYKDVADTAWYADLIKIAQAAGYISGYEDGTMKPNNPISRQEAATIIMKILGLEENSPGADRFKDATSIPAWSKGAVGAVASSGIMGGYPDGTFKAVNLIKRAEAVVALDKALKADVIYDKAGTYGPASGSEEISGNVIISAANVTLQNLVIEGNLTIDEAVGNGDVHLKQVTVKGDTYIYGGGKDSVYFIDCQTGKTYVLKDDGPVRIVVSGTTEINEIIAQSGLTVEEVNLTGEGIEGITVDKKVDGNIEINLRGVEVESLEINTEGVTVRTDRNTVIDKLVANEKTDFKGSGTIKDADINADGVTFDKMPDKYELAENVKPPTRSSSGGGGGSSKVAVSAISVEGVAKVGETLTATITPSGATASYQWMRSDSEDKDGTYTNISGATEKTYKLVAADVGKYIKVKATGTGDYKGTVESKPVGPVVAVTGELVPATDYPGYDSWKDAITEEGIDFGQITQAQAIKMGIADPDYYGIAMYLKVGDDTIELNSDKLESVVRIDPEGNEVEPQVTADNIYQFVHDGWGGPGEYTMRYTLKDGRVIEAKINVVSFEFKDEEPEDPAEAKAAFIAAFNDIIDDIQVEGKTVANAAMTGEDITVTFKTSDAAEILAGAGVVFEALQELAEAESSITINDQKFNLDEELSISALANAILGDGGIEGFLEDKTITVTYTATVFNKSGTEFSLTGNLTFNLDVEDAQK
jgi:predicted RNA-binding protein Jag